MDLAPCPGCGRHLRTSELSCPFCQRALGVDWAPVRSWPRGRRSRAALVLGAGLTVAACGGSGAAPQQPDPGAAVAVYGAPADPSSVPPAASEDPPAGTASSAVPEPAPSPSAHGADAPRPPVAVYGGPPPH